MIFNLTFLLLYVMILEKGNKLTQEEFEDLQDWVYEFSSPFFCISKSFDSDVVFITYAPRNFHDSCDTSLSDSQVLCNVASFGEPCGLKINRRLFDDLKEAKKYMRFRMIGAQLVIEIVNTLASAVGYEYRVVPQIFNVFNISGYICFSIKGWGDLQHHNNPFCPFIRMFGYKECKENGETIMKLRIKKSDMQFLPDTLKLLIK